MVISFKDNKKSFEYDVIRKDLFLKSTINFKKIIVF